MTNPVIHIRKVSKQYRLGEINTGTLSHDLNTWFDSKRNKKSSIIETIDALNNVSLDVESGEVLGVIGNNGAGKSTLLKLISRITAPTSGEIKYKGKVASLLEVGTGMHPEMTARENIYLNGAILGMNKTQIRNKFDEIVAFSDCEKFVDTPIKRFSSGMKVRLGFAVAAHLEADILIVDEVLAVGDSNFQNKCMQKIDEISSQAGRTIIFVSHNMASIQKICSRCVVLDKGILIHDTTPTEAIATYFSQYESALESVNFVPDQENRKIASKPVFRDISIRNETNEVTNSVKTGEPIMFQIGLEQDLVLNDVSIGMGIEDSTGQRLYSVNSLMLSGTFIESRQYNKQNVVFKIHQLNLMPGRYSVSISAVKAQHEWLDTIERAIDFEVIPTDIYGTGRLPTRQQGIVYMSAELMIKENE